MTDYAPLLAQLSEWQQRISLSANHRYRALGDYQPGVTTVADVLDKPGLNRWTVSTQVEGTARMAWQYPARPDEEEAAYIARLKTLTNRHYEHERLSKQAADVGTGVHALIEAEVKRMMGQTVEPVEVPDESIYRFAGWRRWADGVRLKPLASEARLFHSKHRYCGTLDLLCVLYGELAIVDAKPHAEIYTSRRLQLAGYRMALEDMCGTPSRGYINVLPRDGGDITIKEVDPPGPAYEASCAAFLHCLGLYRWNADHERARRYAK